MRYRKSRRKYFRPHTWYNSRRDSLYVQRRGFLGRRYTQRYKLKYNLFDRIYTGNAGGFWNTGIGNKLAWKMDKWGWMKGAERRAYTRGWFDD